MKRQLVPLRVPSSLRKNLLVTVAFVAASPSVAACANAEASEEEQEGSEASESAILDGEGGTCDETINKVDDIRDRFLDERHAAVWAFQNDAKTAFSALETPPTSHAKQAARVAHLEKIAYSTWTPSDKVRARDSRLAEKYLVIRGNEPGGATKVVYVFEWTSGEEVAHARATKASRWSWACPPPKPKTASGGQRRVVHTCRPDAPWNNWPNWSNWNNWCNM